MTCHFSQTIGKVSQNATHSDCCQCHTAWSLVHAIQPDPWQCHPAWSLAVPPSLTTGSSTQPDYWQCHPAWPMVHAAKPDHWQCHPAWPLAVPPSLTAGSATQPGCWDMFHVSYCGPHSEIGPCHQFPRMIGFMCKIGPSGCGTTSAGVPDSNCFQFELNRWSRVEHFSLHFSRSRLADGSKSEQLSICWGCLGTVPCKSQQLIWTTCVLWQLCVPVDRERQGDLPIVLLEWVSVIGCPMGSRSRKAAGV